MTPVQALTMPGGKGVGGGGGPASYFPGASWSGLWGHPRIFPGVAISLTPSAVQMGAGASLPKEEGVIERQMHEGGIPEPPGIVDPLHGIGRRVPALTSTTNKRPRAPDPPKYLYK